MAERRKTIDVVRLMNAQTAEELLGTLLSSFPERSGMITRERYGVVDGRAKTLEEIGKSHGITRERVRQIVDVIMKRIKEVMAQAGEHQLVERVQRVVRSGGGILTIEKLLSLLGKGKITEEKALEALLPAFPGIHIGKETVKRKPVVTVDTFVMKDWESVIAIVTNLLKKSGEVQSLDDLYTHYRKQPDAIDLPKDIFESFLHSSVEIEMNAFGRYGLMHWSTVRPRGTRERAHLILQVMKKPLHFREIARLIDEHGLYKTGKKTHPQTVHNELIKDERFVLVGRGTYALSDWGFRPGTVREVLSSILSEHETPMTREELLKAVMKVRQVKRSTVIINLNSFFTKVGKNIYSLASEKK
jgi:predicted Zn-ribbon and HTH transcriptional regulator